MEEELKDMKFSIICKEDGVETELNGSIFGLSALIATIAQRNDDIAHIIKLAVICLMEEGKANELDEAREDYANN